MAIPRPAKSMKLLNLETFRLYGNFTHQKDGAFAKFGSLVPNSLTYIGAFNVVWFCHMRRETMAKFNLCGSEGGPPNC